MNYYNEYDQKAAAWLRQLIAAGLIPDGVVDTRSITEIKPSELHEYTQCHFFAGVGGWPLALQLAGVPATRPLWTGSCPCQPFSVAGKGLGTADERHLWPVFARLIRECRPSTVLGEQVASKAGREWLAGVFADLEGMAYAVAGADLCAAGVNSPHIRQRLYWGAVRLADSARGQCEQRLWPFGDELQRLAFNGSTGGMADTQGGGLGKHGSASGSAGHVDELREACGVGNANGARLIEQSGAKPVQAEQPPVELRGNLGFWSRYALIPCRDGKARRVEPSIFPLVDGLPRGVVPSGDPGSESCANATAEARVMRLRGYGNAIVPQVAAEFISASLEAIE